MTTYIFLDDLRFPPDDGNRWILVRDIQAAWDAMIGAWYMSHGQEEIWLSMDHDLGKDESGKDLPDGNDLVCKIETAVATDASFRPKLQMFIHSDNCVEMGQMLAGIQSIYRYLRGER